jgi:hypothetical protein
MNEREETPPLDYPRSGNVDWSALLPRAAFALLASAGLALGMNFLYQHGLYYIGVVPVFVALICACLVVLAIHKGHCRSPLVGLMIGAMAGAVSLGGYYYAGMISSFGPEMAARLDLLPRYVALRHAR